MNKSLRYHNYLSNVVDFLQGTPNDFAEVQDILNRYSTLMQVNSDLARRQQAFMSDNEESRRYLVELSKDKANALLQCNNEIASLQKCLDSYSLSSKREQSDSGPIGHELSNTAALGQLRASVQNLLLRFENYSRRAVNNDARKNNNTRVIEGESRSASLQRAEDDEATGSAIERIAEYIIDYSATIDEWQSRSDVKHI